MRNLAMVIVPHPVGGIAPEKVANKADDALEEMLGVFGMPLERVH